MYHVFANDSKKDCKYLIDIMDYKAFNFFTFEALLRIIKLSVLNSLIFSLSNNVC